MSGKARLYHPARRGRARHGLGRCRVRADRRRSRNATSTSRFVRTGSRGLFWLEPMIEVATAGGRIAYGPVERRRRRSVVRRRHARRQAASRCASASPRRFRSSSARRASPSRAAASSIRVDLDDYRAHGGWAGLETGAVARAGGDGRKVTKSGLRGRGGAGFPTGIKWKTVLDTAGAQKYVCLQRRRRRFRHLRRPHDHGRRSVHADRRHGDRGRRGRRDQGLHLYPLGISALDPCHAARHRPRARERDSRRERAGSGKIVRSRNPRRRRRLCLRRRDRDARQSRRQARPGARQAAAAGA